MMAGAAAADIESVGTGPSRSDVVNVLSPAARPSKCVGGAVVLSGCAVSSASAAARVSDASPSSSRGASTPSSSKGAAASAEEERATVAAPAALAASLGEGGRLAATVVVAMRAGGGGAVEVEGLIRPESSEGGGRGGWKAMPRRNGRAVSERLPTPSNAISNADDGESPTRELRAALGPDHCPPPPPGLGGAASRKA